MKKRILSVLFLLPVAGISSQVPTTHILGFEYSIDSDSLYLENGKLLTDFNRNGYNNQPSPAGNRKALISSNWKDSAQTDIYELNLRNNELLRLTATEESEYSPVIMPDKKHFTVVRVENNEESSQVIWKYPLDRSHSGQLLIRNLTDAGYYEWIDEKNLAVFRVGDPISLEIYNFETRTFSSVSDRVGRTFRKHMDRLYYIYKLSDQFWQLKYYDLSEKRSVMVLQSLDGREDFAITPEGHFLIGNGSSLYLYRMGQDKNWKKVADLGSYGVTNISRIHIDSDNLYLVTSDS